MKKPLLVLCAASVLAAPLAFAQDNPWAGMKGKIREGQWEYTMQLGAMPGMPAGMKLPPQVIRHCITAQDVERGGVGQKDGKMPDGCAVKNVKVSGNSASYRMECTKDPKMVADVSMTFSGDTFQMKQKMQMNQDGQVMNMTNDMTGRYLGACGK